MSRIPGTGPTVVLAIDVTDVWSGHPVAFSLLTRNDQQFAAFYDANRQMTIAARSLTSTTWHLVGCQRHSDGTATTM